MTETSSASGSSMNTSTTDQARHVIVGATGMVGGYALRYALEHSAVGTVTAIGRRRLGISHAKLREVLHQDFADCSALAAPLSGQDAAIFCLGTYTGAVSDAELRKTTVDYTIEFARVLRLSSPGAAFSFLSGGGADPTGRSRIPYAPYKGQAENALIAAGFPSVYIFRPAYIYPVEPRKEPRETEAEAFVVCQSIGLQTGSASGDYIQLWNGDAKLLAESLEVVQRTAAVILGAISPRPATSEDAETANQTQAEPARIAQPPAAAEALSGVSF